MIMKYINVCCNSTINKTNNYYLVFGDNDYE